MKGIKTYHEPQWERVRAQALRRDGYQDQLLKRYGKVKEAEVVHHIFPVDQFPQYQLCLWNLISITRATHNELHIRDTQALSRKGIELLQATARRQGIPIPDIPVINTKPKRRTSFYDPPHL